MAGHCSETPCVEPPWQSTGTWRKCALASKQDGTLVLFQHHGTPTQSLTLCCLIGFSRYQSQFVAKTQFWMRNGKSASTLGQLEGQNQSMSQLVGLASSPKSRSPPWKQTSCKFNFMRLWSYNMLQLLIHCDTRCHCTHGPIQSSSIGLANHNCCLTLDNKLLRGDHHRSNWLQTFGSHCRPLDGPSDVSKLAVTPHLLRHCAS